MSDPVSTTVTWLEMRSVDELVPKRFTDVVLRVEEASMVQWQFNRFLYQVVGGDWNWNDKAGWSDAKWASYAEDPALRTFVAYLGGSPAGYCEMRTAHGETEIVYFGLLPAFIARGLGGPFLTEVLEMAWASEPRPNRIWLHTCSQDHPSAIANYLARGMRVYRRDA